MLKARFSQYCYIIRPVSFCINRFPKYHIVISQGYYEFLFPCVCKGVLEPLDILKGKIIPFKKVSCYECYINVLAFPVLNQLAKGIPDFLSSFLALLPCEA